MHSKCSKLMAMISFLFISSFLIGCSQNTPMPENLKKGNYYVNQRKYDEAIIELDKEIQINPTSAKAYYDRGRAYDGKKNFDLAITDYTKSIELNDPETIQCSYNNRGYDYEREGNPNRALSYYTKGIEAMPNPMFSGFRQFKAVLHYNRANIYLSNKLYDKAWEDVHSIEALGNEVESGFLDKLKRLSGREK